MADFLPQLLAAGGGNGGDWVKVIIAIVFITIAVIRHLFEASKAASKKTVKASKAGTTSKKSGNENVGFFIK